MTSKKKKKLSKTELLFNRIQQNNEKFKNATKAQKRVLIAKDVLEWLDVNLIRPENGSYVRRSDYKKDIDYDYEKHDKTQLNKTILEGGSRNSCYVCGVGALFVGAVMRYDNICNGDFNGNCSDINIGIGGLIEFDDELVDYLSKYFTRRQIALVEVAFEVEDYFDSDEPFNSSFACLSDEAASKASNFGMQYKENKQRLIAIMKNIIKNDGQFIP